MNVVFISPHFPRHFYQFCARLKERGVTVLGIGDAPFDAIGENCQNSLSDYRYVSSLQDYEQVYRAVADYVFRYGRIDFVESENEYWLELDAKIRTDFNIATGPKFEAMAAMNRKSRMKEAYARAKIPTARWTLPQTQKEASDFAHKVGYPVIVKPDKGVGASNTYKLKSDAELADFWASKPADVPYIEEELVPGHVETFDGVTDSKKNVLFCASQCLPVSLMDAVNHDEDVVSYCQAPGDDLRAAGERILKEFDTRNKFFHFEFFRLDADKKGLGKKGDIVGLEVNMRPPGGIMPELMNYEHDIDVYQIWADMMVHNKLYANVERKYVGFYVSRRDSHDYVHTHEEIMERYGENVMQYNKVDEIFASVMGNHVYLMRAEDQAKTEEIIDFVVAQK